MNVYFVLALSGIDHVSFFANRVFLSLIAIQVGGSPFMMGVLGATFAFFPMLLSVTTSYFLVNGRVAIRQAGLQVQGLVERSGAATHLLWMNQT